MLSRTDIAAQYGFAKSALAQNPRAWLRWQLAVKADDPRGLRGAVEEACYQMFARAHTAMHPPTEWRRWRMALPVMYRELTKVGVDLLQQLRQE